MSENKLANLSTEFAIKILKLTDSIKGHYSLTNQLERSETDMLLRIYMIDDTKNRVLTYDKVVIKGTYRHSAKTLSDCTCELIAE